MKIMSSFLPEHEVFNKVQLGACNNRVLSSAISHTLQKSTRACVKLGRVQRNSLNSNGAVASGLELFTQATIDSSPSRRIRCRWSVPINYTPGIINEPPRKNDSLLNFVRYNLIQEYIHRPTEETRKPLLSGRQKAKERKTTRGKSSHSSRPSSSTVQSATR